jgi:hypothetical protein
VANYYPFIARVVSGLDKNTAASRRVIYDAARSRLLDEMRKAGPPLTEADLTHERLDLEQAIRRVEMEELARKG